MERARCFGGTKRLHLQGWKTEIGDRFSFGLSRNYMEIKPRTAYHPEDRITL
jgi:hypothetical protein